MKAAEQQAAKNFANGRRVEGEELEELSLAGEDSIGNDGVQMRVEVGAEGTESLNRHDAAGTDVLAAWKLLRTES